MGPMPAMGPLVRPSMGPPVRLAVAHEPSTGLRAIGRGRSPVRRPHARSPGVKASHVSKTLALSLVRDGRLPLYRQVEAQVRAAIEDGRLRPDTRLPGIRSLAADLGVARVTVATAYEQLAADGYLVGRVGSGTRVAHDHPASSEWPRPRWTPAPGDARPAGPAPLPARSSAARAPAGRLPVVRFDLRPGAIVRAGVPGGFPTAAWESRLRAAWREIAGSEVEPVREPVASLRAALSGALDAARGTRSDARRVVVGRGPRVLIAALVAALDRERRSDRLPVLGFLPPCDPGWVETARRAGAATLAIDPARAPLHAAAGVVLVEDDRPALLRLGGPASPALQGGLGIGRVTLVGAIDPLIVPGTSLAWMIVPGSIAEAVAAEVEALDGTPDPLAALALADWIADGGLDRRCRRLRHALLERRAGVVAALREELGRAVEIEPQDHRPVVTVRLALAAPVRAALERAALRHGVAIAALDEEGRLLLGIAGLDGDQLVEAIRRVGRALDRLDPDLRAADRDGGADLASVVRQPERGRLGTFGRALAGRRGPAARP